MGDAGMSLRRWLLIGVVLVVAGGLAITNFVHRQHSSAYVFKTVTTECSPDLRGEAAVGDLVLHIGNGGRLSINHETITGLTALRDRLTDIYKTRQRGNVAPPDCEIYRTRQLCDIQEEIRRRVLFLDIDARLPAETAANAMTIASRAVPNVKFVVLTPETRETCEEKWASVPPGW